ncbi:hypothetical protein GCM10011506_20560 [Marivirga lumbricoides]|uniref:Flagellar motor protein MotB n=1 Tax=Marivirga lumbricoides TaxID=1046115 RepID=A0ABQ1M9W8_9BACT|nr:hypothetical protein GCM10011506_20560 [Marivirga lumbricoides]
MTLFHRNILFLNVFLLVFLLAVTNPTYAQESVLKLLKNEQQIADTYFEQKNYHSALEKYLSVIGGKSGSHEVNTKIARCYFFLHEYGNAAMYYSKAIENNNKLVPDDLLRYAEVLVSTGAYQEAILTYRDYLSVNKNDESILKKIWRLQNINFLYEDSLYYTLKKLPINSPNGDLAPVPYKKGLVFVSNRESVSVVKKVDAKVNAPFYRLYFTQVKGGYDHISDSTFTEPVLFDKAFHSNYHLGPVAFFLNQNKMVFTRSSHESGNNGISTLQLYFASNSGIGWRKIMPFPFNSQNFSNTDPTINEAGTLLIFSSDRPGGFGGKDLYKSEFIDGSWTDPVNLGENINTAGDEVFPYLHEERTLYFSTDGHPGLGGLDIFKAEIINSNIENPANIGYPLNSGYDDFGIFIDSTGTRGYLSSNRTFGGYNDDIYMFEMDLQPYPLTVNGIIKYIEHNWMDSSELKTMGNVKLFLIDDFKDEVVAESTSDKSGNFMMTVPYYSKYKIQVVGENIEGIVSFEVPKHQKSNDKYDIVVVNDDFDTTSNENRE